MANTHLSIPGRVRPALAALLSAFDYAQDIGVDTWQFAIALRELLDLGATNVDVRWLVLRQHAEHAREVTIPGDGKRLFRELPTNAFPDDLCLILSDAGARILRSYLGELEHPATGLTSTAGMTAASACPEAIPEPENIPRKCAPPLAPVWDPRLRELRLGTEVIKSFTRPAEAQETILASFEEEGWPPAVDDPLPVQFDQDPKRRLHYTVRNLNRGQSPLRIRFFINGNGETIRWEVVGAGECHHPDHRSHRAPKR